MTITLPAAVGRVSTKVAVIQPIAGSSPPSAVPIPAAPSRLVARISAQKASDATGIPPRLWENWKLPIIPCIAPSTNSAAYAATTPISRRCRVRPPSSQSRLYARQSRLYARR